MDLNEVDEFRNKVESERLHDTLNVGSKDVGEDVDKNSSLPLVDYIAHSAIHEENECWV